MRYMYIKRKFGIRDLLSVNYIPFVLTVDVTYLLGSTASFALCYVSISLALNVTKVLSYVSFV